MLKTILRPPFLRILMLVKHHEKFTGQMGLTHRRQRPQNEDEQRQHSFGFRKRHFDKIAGMDAKSNAATARTIKIGARLHPRT